MGCFFITQWAVLVAIAIPVFTTQLEKSREATDIANIRSAYAEVVAAGLVDTAKPHSAQVTYKQQVNGWATDNNTEIAGVKISTISSTAGDTITVAWVPASGAEDAKVTIGGQNAQLNFGVS